MKLLTIFSCISEVKAVQYLNPKLEKPGKNPHNDSVHILSIKKVMQTYYLVLFESRNRTSYSRERAFQTLLKLGCPAWQY